MRILVLEDDAELASWLVKGLKQHGHVIDHFTGGKDALMAAMTHRFDVLVLDRMTDDLDGLSVLKALRAAKNMTPALFLTAMGNVEDRVEGLSSGGDDYLTKPFAFAEFLARIEVLARRLTPTEAADETILCVADIKLDIKKRKCWRGDEEIALNSKEFLLLEALMRNRGRVLTRTMLLEMVWDISRDPTTSVVETHISRLRAKLDRPFEDKRIRTLRGAGYVFDH